MTEHHHVAALRGSDVEELPIDYRPAQTIGVLVHHDEIAIEQRGHHRVRRNAERLEDERAHDEHDERDRKETAGIVDRARLRQNDGRRLRRGRGRFARLAEEQLVDAPDDSRADRQQQEHQAEIERFRGDEPQDHADDQPRQDGIGDSHQRRIRHCQ
jgi:hypothetical protein